MASKFFNCDLWSGFFGIMEEFDLEESENPTSKNYTFSKILNGVATSCVWDGKKKQITLCTNYTIGRESTYVELYPCAEGLSMLYAILSASTKIDRSNPSGAIN